MFLLVVGRCKCAYCVIKNEVLNSQFFEIIIDRRHRNFYFCIQYCNRQ